MKPLDGGIARQVYRAMKAAKMTTPATLIKVTPGTRNPSNLSGGTQPTEQSYAAAGFIDDFAVQAVDGTIIFAGDRRITLFGASIAGGQSPAVNDKITIKGSTYRIRRVESDPANAAYTCQTHGPALS